MNTLVSDPRTFHHVLGISSRDTGVRVVALPPGTREVRVLGGGAAMVWRALVDGDEVGQVVERLHQEFELVVSEPQVQECLDELTRTGLIREAT